MNTLTLLAITHKIAMLFSGVNFPVQEGGWAIQFQP
ncbi:hypothetical protein SEEH3312_10068 [Salmonella enterica subsp. enterica serovar Heidelberg str. RI-11-013312]|uniref:Uncharacterized protein n=1 Tax=Salmonella paratyphi B (strain ATCC BAA-1250 / SPB7) TaxID=1016998 RepID=A0A6C6Z938_SALPB|nr:hypothetical protein SPAB_04895 [Salmonella enterica subsp. enterica serovar Paratyphi B str. SPB7]KDU71874.1 hypothetical protein SEEH3312_10068 [Salmonella enterica subsp. enterica serovar Heidelberg str. RI-11-013312]